MDRRPAVRVSLPMDWYFTLIAVFLFCVIKNVQVVRIELVFDSNYTVFFMLVVDPER